MTADADVPALARAEQIAWEAPTLRPTFTPFHRDEEWAHPCPDWCCGGGPGHDVEAIVGFMREHQSTRLEVKVDSGYGYERELDDGTEGISAAHLNVWLSSGSRTPDRARVGISYSAGAKDGSGRMTRFKIAPMFPDEVRELICVLQHLLKVAQA